MATIKIIDPITRIEGHMKAEVTMLDYVPGPAMAPWNSYWDVEQALIGIPVRAESRPIEVLRVIQSFDPCLACAVHVMRPCGKPLAITKA